MWIGLIVRSFSHCSFWVTPMSHSLSQISGSYERNEEAVHLHTLSHVHFIVSFWLVSFIIWIVFDVFFSLNWKL
ncbi:hypothetical protein EUTSA_v10012403mg [Eutrema salsugineum]|uniref:Uncharacterized protein n=1 Tax=Eutrema salsugineum TaxID=72664 RepID=V4KTN4_EUTSA|nr:hypothetical protein EUTSA_v10012403mg [Eutrema salsugineum]